MSNICMQCHDRVDEFCAAARVAKLIFPHDSLVLVKLFARGAHDTVLLAADVTAVWRLDCQLGVSMELEYEWLWYSLVCVETAVTVH